MATILENVYTLSAHLEDAYDALEAKGATIPATKNAANLSATIDTVQSGQSFADLFNADLNLVFTGLTAIPDNPSHQDSTGKNCFRRWTNIKSVSFPDLVSVGSYGCYCMFMQCFSLSAAPILPATTLASNCYYAMFQTCTALSAAPILPATTLADSCYSNMFRYCSSLTTPPALPATTLASNCYYGMFQNCTSLTTIPELPVASLAQQCYNYMFSGCTSLTGTITIPVLNTNTSIPSYAFQNMFQGCSNLTKVILDFSTFSSIPTLGASNTINVFNSTTDARFEIHVPSALEETWKTASNWSTWASHIVGV